MSATRSRSNPGGISDVLAVLGQDVEPLRGRKPPWFKVPAPGGARYRALHKRIESENLHTVCQEAACPNIGECWQHGTATFMILGDTCTRRCGFCNVKTGKPTWNDPLEPARVARSVARMGLRHAVITSVDRDDLPDYGAGAFAHVIREIRRQAPECQDRGADARLPRPGDAAGESDRRAPRRVQPQRRGRPAAVPGGPAGLDVRTLLPRAGDRQGVRRRAGHHEVRSDGRAGGESFEEMVDTLGALRAAPRAGADRRPVSATHRAITCRSSATGIQTSSRRSSRLRTGSASSTLPPGHSFARAITPISTCRRASPAGAAQ